MTNKTPGKKDKQIRKYAKQLALIAKLRKELDRELLQAIDGAKDQPELVRRRIDISAYKNPSSFKFLNENCEEINNFLYALMSDIPLLHSLGLASTNITFGKIPLNPVPDAYRGYDSLCLDRGGLEIFRRDLRDMADHPWETEPNRNTLFYFDFAGKPLVCWKNSSDDLELAANTIVHNYGGSSYGWGTEWYKPQITADYLRDSLYKKIKDFVKFEDINKLKMNLSRLERLAK